MKKFFKSLIYVPKYAKIDDTNIIKYLLPSVSCILFSLTLLFSLTWSWFSSDVETEQTLKSANFSVSVEITETNGGTILQPSGGLYNLQGNTPYNIKITGDGTLTAMSSGYCKVTLGNGTEHFTPQLTKDSNVTFTLIVPDSTTVKFTPVWGTYTGQADIADGGQIGQVISNEQQSYSASNDNTNTNAVLPSSAPAANTVPQNEQTITEPDDDVQNVPEAKAPADKKTDVKETEKETVASETVTGETVPETVSDDTQSNDIEKTNKTNENETA